jgi:hypothetical protein
MRDSRFSVTPNPQRPSTAMVADEVERCASAIRRVNTRSRLTTLQLEPRPGCMPDRHRDLADYIVRE